jgi:hypothetical protein
MSRPARSARAPLRRLPAQRADRGCGEGDAEEGAHGGVQLEFADDLAGINSNRGARALAVSCRKADKQ